jgi:hypothetical protein
MSVTAATVPGSISHSHGYAKTSGTGRVMAKSMPGIAWLSVTRVPLVAGIAVSVAAYAADSG